jgi:ferric-dicitrate binding protein FerR (iron transport regulator)
VSQKLSHEAVDWFVLNESGTAEDAELAQRWEQWCTELGNRVEYVSLLQLTQDMRTLPAPAKASRTELLKDVAAEEGASGMSRTG